MASAQCLPWPLWSVFGVRLYWSHFMSSFLPFLLVKFQFRSFFYFAGMSVIGNDLWAQNHRLSVLLPWPRSSFSVAAARPERPRGPFPPETGHPSPVILMVQTSGKSVTLQATYWLVYLTQIKRQVCLLWMHDFPRGGQWRNLNFQNCFLISHHFECFLVRPTQYSQSRGPSLKHGPVLSQTDTDSMTRRRMRGDLCGFKGGRGGASCSRSGSAVWGLGGEGQPWPLGPVGGLAGGSLLSAACPRAPVPRVLAPGSVSHPAQCVPPHPVSSLETLGAFFQVSVRSKPPREICMRICGAVN